MAAKAVRIASGDTTYLPITTSDLVQMNGTTQSLTTYINNIKETVESIEDTNSAKMTVITKYGNMGQNLGTYAYISPTGDKDTENGSVLEIIKGDNIQIYGGGDTITISALNSKIYQYTSGTSNVKYPFLTKYTNGASGNTNGGDYSRITSNGSDSSLFAYFNPSNKISYFQYVHSTEFTENGVKLSDKYAEIGHVHYLYGQNESYTDDMGDTVNVMIGFVNNNTITTSTENNSPVPLSYYSYSVPTKKYVDDNFVTQSVFNTAQASGMHYLGDTATLPSNPSSGDMYHTTAAMSSIGAESGDFITYYKAQGASTGSWSVWDKNVDKALYAGTNTLVDGRILVANGTTGNVRTQAWPALSIDTTVSSAAHTFPVSIKYDAGNPNINTSVSFEGDTGVTLQKKYYAGSAYISISYTPDHIGSGTTGHLTYWKSGTNHASLSSSYGSNNENNVQLHWIDNGVLKNVSVGVGSNSIPTYVDSSGHIKQVTSIDSSLYTNTDINVKSQSSTSNGNYPFLTKSTTGIGTLTSTALQSGNSNKYAYYNPALGVAYLPYAYSTEFTENGTKLANKYAAKSHTHNYAFEFLPDDIIPDGFMPTGNTVTAIAYFNGDSSLSLIEDTTQTLRYASVILPTKKYIDTLVSNSSSGNSAKVGWYYDDDTDDQEDVYAYVGPNGTQADVTNGVGSAIHFKAGSYIYISYSGGAFNIGAVNDRVDQQAMSNTNSNYPLLTKYSAANYNFENSFTRFSATSSSNIIAYVNPGKKILYSKYSYSDEYTENGQKLFNKYTTYAYLNSKLSNVAGKLDFTVVRSVMDDITII